MRTVRFHELESLVGDELGSSEWHLVDQARVNAFAEVTGDHQWIHVDPERAAAGPFGGTIAHGYLPLSLLPALRAEGGRVEDARMGINYGLNRVRFPALVSVGSRVRATFEVAAVEEAEWGTQVTMTATVERDDADKPVCVAEVVFRYYA